MEFNNQYLTYNEFLNFDVEGLGEMPFNLLEFEVRKKIDERTQNRLVNLVEIPTDVKICVYKCIKTLQKYEKINKNISSESTDGYSVAYNTDSVEDNFNSDIDGIICECLNNVIVNGVPVLYLGVL